MKIPLEPMVPGVCYPFFANGAIVVTDEATGFFLVRTTFSIFSDGFESGDTDAWSNAGRTRRGDGTQYLARVKPYAHLTEVPTRT